MQTAAHYLNKLAQATHRPEDELMAAAFRVGLCQLWREFTLEGYLRGEISRTQAIAEAGIDSVELADRQRQAVQEDLEWAMKE
ncbi:hypothetical protein [uncultured Thiodictyon sp.]|uniref:hypothetical protein n=1 Tax=uncultured Thiodictyon sp. TaxID=1846217 RepID=UPI0025E29A1C|nr:hypothetical protein [uncultured Thiodictyon sp.]